MDNMNNDKNELQPISDVLLEWRFREGLSKENRRLKVMIAWQHEVMILDSKIIARYRKWGKILIGLFILELGFSIVQMIIK